MATIRDVAKASGVSTATVSHVLSGRLDRVSGETRERVLRSVRELRYRPVAAEVDQRAIPTRNIGVMTVVRPDRPLLRNLYLQHVMDGVYEAAALAGWSVTVFIEGMWEDAHRDIRRYVDGRCEGMLLIAPPQTSQMPEALAARGTPFVLMNDTREAEGYSSVDIDHAATAETAVRHLIGLGHARIAYLRGDATQPSVHHRERGYREAMRSAGLRVERDWIRGNRYSAEAGCAATLELMRLREGNRPTAIFAASEAIALGALEGLRSLGLSCPRDVSLISIDDLGAAERANPPLTMIRQPIQQMGRRACEMLMRLARADRPATERVIFPTEMVVRESTAPPPVSIHASIPDQLVPTEVH